MPPLSRRLLREHYLAGESSFFSHFFLLLKLLNVSKPYSTLGTNLFRQHLFPELSIGEDDKYLIPRIPLLNPTTRRTMSDTIYFLVKDDEEQYKALLMQLSQLVPHSTEDGMFVLFLLSRKFHLPSL